MSSLRCWSSSKLPLMLEETFLRIARGAWENHPKTHALWYRPIEDPDNIKKAVQYVLSFPDLFLCSVGSTQLLPEVLKAAASFDPASDGPDNVALEKMREELLLTMPGNHGWTRLWNTQ